ncbi:hypothetical protein FRC05_006085 [Tulasnella sp. 425]|nr:hypothetical protein FRC05_006085 [Tulasnella sp. 425]
MNNRDEEVDFVPHLGQQQPMQYSRAGGPGYPAGYSIPPRGAMQQQSFPAMQSRTAHPMVPTSQGAYLQQRGGSGTFFNPASAMNLPMQPSPGASLPSLQQQQASQTSLALQQQHQQQQHAQQQATLHLGGQGTGASTTSSESVIDQNEFPPLGSTGGPQSSGTASGASSAQGGGFHSTYASQAGQAMGSAALTSANSQQPQTQRDFGRDEFPPLGAQSATQASLLSGLGQNGLANISLSQQTTNQSQLMGGPNAQRGLQGLASDLDKRAFNKLSAASSMPWSQQAAPGQGFPNGQALGAPPNLPTPGSSFNSTGQSAFPSQQQQSQAGTASSLSQQQLQPDMARQGQAPSGQQPPPRAPPPNSHTALPQTPAQQILLSAADRWGLLGLLASIKGTDPDAQLLGSGTDLAQIGLDLTAPGPLSSTFITPWSDSTAAQSIEPEFHLPPCYNVQAPAPGPQKVASFSDETLFFMFYSSPRDTLQEVAAQELYNRNWRYHKEAQVWLTKETGQSPLQKDAAFERGTYTFFDRDRWEKVKKDATIYYEQLEERALPQSLNAMSMTMAGMPMGTMAGMQAQAQQLPMRG